MLELILGGARSGKSSYAEKRAGSYPEVVYLATAKIEDEEMAHRVELHKKRRKDSWRTLEKYRGFTRQDLGNEPAILLDCLTMMVTGLLFDENFEDYSDEDFQRLEEKIWQEIEGFLDISQDRDVLLVSNELGMGLVPEDRLSRIFRDMMGRFHQLLAKRADRVTLVVAGIPVVIK